MNRKKITRALIRMLASLLPFWLRNRLISYSVHLPTNISDDFSFRVAQNEADLEASFGLVYDSYVELGYCEPNPHKMRATVYHSLATTSTLLAFYKDQAVGTLTIVRDNRHGLPLEQVFNVSPLRNDANRLAEITSLTIHKNFRREHGGIILFPLLRLMYQYAFGLFGVNRLVITVDPRARNFYESLLLFEEVKNQGIKKYLGAPALCLELNLDKAESRYKKIYSSRSASRNLYNFFIERPIPQIHLPPRTWNKIYDPIVTLKYFENFLVKKLGLPRHIPGDRRSISRTIQRPRGPRFESTLQVKIRPLGWGDSFRGVIKDISKTGFRVFSKTKIQPDKIYEFVIQISSTETCSLKATPVWGKQDRGVGFRILSAEPTWYEYLKYLKQELAGKKVS